MILTFYSYKGGVGRSMALANVAECLYQRGARSHCRLGPGSAGARTLLLFIRRFPDRKSALAPRSDRHAARLPAPMLAGKPLRSEVHVIRKGRPCRATTRRDFPVRQAAPLAVGELSLSHSSTRIKNACGCYLRAGARRASRTAKPKIGDLRPQLRCRDRYSHRAAKERGGDLRGRYVVANHSKSTRRVNTK